MSDLSFGELMDLLQPAMVLWGSLYWLLYGFPSMCRAAEEAQRERVRRILGREPTEYEFRYYQRREREKYEREEAQRRAEALRRIDEVLFGRDEDARLTP